MPLLTYENVILLDCAESSIHQMAKDVAQGCAPTLAAVWALNNLAQLVAMDSVEELRYLLDEKLVRIRAALTLAHKYYSRPTVIRALGEQAAKKLRDDYAELLASMRTN